MADGIVLNRLCKYYGRSRVAALDNVSFHVKPGEIYGFLGANGAGKSTTIRLLMNFLQPSGGSATIMGLDIVKQASQIKQQTGYLAGEVALYDKPTGGELLDYLASLQGRVDTSFRRQLEERFEADLDKPIQDLSKGNRQKIGILQAFMHQPAVLILDEPTSGLDPLMQEAFYATLQEAKARGAAILMSSHNLAEAQRVCDRIGIIKHGKLIREQTIEDDAQLGKTTFRVVLANPADIAALQQAPHLQFVSAVGTDTAIVQTTGNIAEALQALSTFNIKELRTQQLDLEDEFIESYGDQA